MKISKAKFIKIIELKDTHCLCQIISNTSNNSTIDYYRRIIAKISSLNRLGPAFDKYEIRINNVELIIPYDEGEILGAVVIEKKKKIEFTYDFNNKDGKSIILKEDLWAIRSIQIIKSYQRKGIGTDLVNYIVEDKNNNILMYPIVSTMIEEEGIRLFKKFKKIYRA